MTDELFTTPETLSPRLRWMKEHGITTNPDWWSVFDDAPCWAATCMGRTVEGDTEEEALVNLAVKLGIPDWRQQ